MPDLHERGCERVISVVLRVKTWRWSKPSRNKKFFPARSSLMPHRDRPILIGFFQPDLVRL
jgi:hypothetical protein